MEAQSVICEIFSHSHAPPLRPAADLSFDLRRLPNPPKHIRDQYDGRSKRLREHLIHEPDFTKLLEEATQQILQAAEVLWQGYISSDCNKATVTSGVQQACHGLDEQPEENVLAESSSGRTYGPTVSDSRKHDIIASLEPVVVNSQSKEHPLAESGESVEEEEVGLEEEEPKSDPVLRISCFCERGRHRSVAFAEELGRRLDSVSSATGAVQVVVKVQHRDVEVKSKQNSGRMRDFGRGRSRVLGAALIADHHEDSQDLE